jgi:hypothetical protein
VSRLAAAQVGQREGHAADGFGEAALVEAGEAEADVGQRATLEAEAAADLEGDAAGLGGAGPGDGVDAVGAGPHGHAAARRGEGELAGEAGRERAEEASRRAR